MSDATLNDVVDRLERVEGAILKLVAVMEDGGGRAARGEDDAKALLASALAVAAQPRVSAPVVSGPPVVPVAPAPLQVKVGKPPTDLAAPRVTQGAKSKESYDPYSHRDDLKVPAPGASLKQVLARVFEAALMPDPEDTWALLTKLTHSNQMVGPRAIDHFKAFAWHKARRTAANYLEGGDPKSFVISYTEPADIGAGDQRVKVFVRKPDGRMPAPIALAKDAAKGGGWRLTMISL